VIRWKLLEYFLVYKLCNSLDILIGLQRETPYSKSNQRATEFLRHNPLCPWLLSQSYGACLSIVKVYTVKLDEIG